MNQREKQNACQIKQEVVSDDELKVSEKMGYRKIEELENSVAKIQLKFSR